jgi:hypothetical protein
MPFTFSPADQRRCNKHAAGYDYDVVVRLVKPTIVSTVSTAYPFFPKRGSGLPLGNRNDREIFSARLINSEKELHF